MTTNRKTDDHLVDIPGPEFKPRPAKSEEKFLASVSAKRGLENRNFPKSFFAATCVAKMIAGPSKFVDLKKNLISKGAFEVGENGPFPETRDLPNMEGNASFIVYGRRLAQRVIQQSKPGDYLLFPLLQIAYFGEDDHLLKCKVKGWHGNGFVTRVAYNISALAAGRFGRGAKADLEDVKNWVDRINTKKQAEKDPW